MIENPCHRGRFLVLSSIFNKSDYRYFWMTVGLNKTEVWKIDTSNFVVKRITNEEKEKRYEDKSWWEYRI